MAALFTFSYPPRSMLVKTYAGAVQGVDAQTIVIEVSTGGAVGNTDKPGIFIVGLPDKSVSEGQSRLEAAFKNSRIHLPRLKTIINSAYRHEFCERQILGVGAAPVSH